MERLDAGEVVIGDGGFVFALEKRGYVKAGPWTPEATVQYPEAGWVIHLLRSLMSQINFSDARRIALSCANIWTILQFCPEVRQLHREFLRAGANVMQTFTFYASDDKLENRGNKLTFTVSSARTSHNTQQRFRIIKT